MFLAFPAILLASLAMLEQKHGTDDAVHDDRGAVLGSVGLLAFAIIAAALFEHTSAAITLGAATGSWIVASAGAYLAVAALRQARSRSHM